MFFSLKLVLFVIAVCIFSVSGRPSRMTNSQRFVLGLPPLPPRKLFDATHIDTAAKARRSATAGTPFTCGAGSSQGFNFAECCTAVDGSGNGTGCDGNQSNTDTCTAGETAACCSAASGDTATGCTGQ